ncbi:hypothetical protein RN22_12870 [Grimontia sp. AD028]|uniref:type II secretion system protein n=1 Tax=Grimontia sp. AD028 TaxID=1581149 RepID=UPI00061ADF4E|nr:type II secretion system protein [Grimontia sp. AD028]KKD60024.1 hypothetical protein RN22_12870 [Grimontia sp. AD028]
MKRQGGFTLIEMIVVIVILGILAVTAAPKFLNMQDEAQEGALQGLKGAMTSAASMVHAKVLINGDSADEDGVGSIESITTKNGYPDATITGIGAAIEGVSADGTNTDWKPHTDATASDGKYTFSKNGGTKCVTYNNAVDADTAPVIIVGDCS